jgi:hypothetical protein
MRSWLRERGQDRGGEPPSSSGTPRRCPVNEQTRLLWATVADGLYLLGSERLLRSVGAASEGRS